MSLINGDALFPFFSIPAPGIKTGQTNFSTINFKNPMRSKLDEHLV
ncbi:hypothetical protein O59_000019 [Cellvibrio sp. BR]|nr:hypothetical protein O59_000019 [Cellvibrio sp. BR]